MARNPEIEAILEAWFAWQISLAADKEKSKSELDALLRRGCQEPIHLHPRANSGFFVTSV
jgi:hypothetical protein